MNSDASFSSSSAQNNHQFHMSIPDRDFNYTALDASERAVARGGVACPFPWRLHEMLKVAAQEGLEHVVSWAPHGKAFTVHKPAEFVEKLMMRFFCQTKFASFQRQLNLYGFSRFCHGRDKGAYYHSAFIRGQRALVREMVRRKIKGCAGAVRRPLPTEEPNFYVNVHSRDTTNNTTTTNDDDDLEPLRMDDHDHNSDDSHHNVVSPVPPFVFVNKSEPKQQGPTQQPSSITREVSWDKGHLSLQQQQQQQPQEESSDLAFFEGSPFHCVDEGTSPTAVLWDPATELAKLRAQIRQKQAEYQQITQQRRRQSNATVTARRRRVSFETHPSTLSTPATTAATTTAAAAAPLMPPDIPVYKGSYISV